MSTFSHRPVMHGLCVALLVFLGACSVSIPANQSTAMHKPTSQKIGPFPAFSGRLIVINPSRRWQVEIDWQAYQPNTGKLRLNHAFSSTIVDFRWNNSHMEIRDNKFPYWRDIQQKELTEHGIMLPPNQLASILLGNIPSSFHQKKNDTWESKQSGSLIRLHWQPALKKLTISDIQHGRVAKLIIH